MTSDQEPQMHAQSTHVPLPRIDYGRSESAALSFTAGALITTTLCVIGYALYTWFG